MTHPRDIFRDRYGGQFGLWPAHITGPPEDIADVAADLLALVVVDRKTDQIRAHLNPIVPADDLETWTRVIEACAEWRDDDAPETDLIFQYNKDTGEAMCCIVRGDEPRGIAFRDT